MDWVKEKLDEFEKTKSTNIEKKKNSMQESFQKEKIIRDQIQKIVNEIIYPTFNEFSKQLKGSEFNSNVSSNKVILASQGDIEVLDKISFNINFDKGIPKSFIKFDFIGQNKLDYEYMYPKQMGPTNGTFNLEDFNKIKLEEVLKIFLEGLLNSQL
jgi:hypothetical protein